MVDSGLDVLKELLIESLLYRLPVPFEISKDGGQRGEAGALLNLVLSDSEQHLLVSPLLLGRARDVLQIFHLLYHLDVA